MSSKLPENAESPQQITDLTYTEQEFHGSDFSGWQFHSVIFHRCNFSHCDISYARFVNCQFRSCNFDRCHFLQSEILYSQFSNCTGHSSNFSLSHLKFTSWFSCILEYTVFAKTQWENSSVQDCRLPETYMPYASLSKTSFRRTDWSKSNFTGTALNGIDLSSCQVKGLHLSDSLEELRGAKISREQSAEFIRLLGVKISKNNG